MEADLKNNYLYWMMFSKWKEEKKEMGEPVKKIWGNPNFNNAPPNHRNLEDEWTDQTPDVEMVFPDDSEIDKMNIKLDMFDVERFNSINAERDNRLSEMQKEDAIFDLDKMDKQLFNSLDQEEQREYQ